MEIVFLSRFPLSYFSQCVANSLEPIPRVPAMIAMFTARNHRRRPWSLFSSQVVGSPLTVINHARVDAPGFLRDSLCSGALGVKLREQVAAARSDSLSVRT